MSQRLSLWLACLVMLGLRVPVASAGDTTVDFDRDIRPILSDKCFACHGPDEVERQADLRLDVRESVFEDRGGYAAVVAGDPDASELIGRIESRDPDYRMPPESFPRQLTESERQAIRAWVESGAEWNRHWAYDPPVRPPQPQVRDAGWLRNPIDAFVLARLETTQRVPADVASREELIRRVTLDLTGLPPTPREVQAFLDDRRPDSYERLVDRLLASPTYGETMARPWLDAARYADTDGYQNDGPRTMWRWRDWVIDAYNAGMPFDEFTVRQLAGDLLPGATRDDLIATGFNRNHRYNSEAGLVLEEFLLENAVDRVDTTATVWMGLTAGCARCHDHKYDPISQRDYYRMIALFDNVAESGRAVKFGNSEPWITAPTFMQQRTLDGLVEQEAAARTRWLDSADAVDEAIHEWCRQASTDAANPRPIVSRGRTHHFRFDTPAVAGEVEDETAAEEGSAWPLEEGVYGSALALDGGQPVELGQVGRFNSQQPFTVGFWLRPESRDGVVLSRQQLSTRRPGLAVELRDGRLQFFIITRWVAGVGAVESHAELKPGEWVHVTLTSDGSKSARGMQIWLDGRPVQQRVLYNTNSNDGGAPNDAVLRAGGGVIGKRASGRLDELTIFNRDLWPDEIRHLAWRFPTVARTEWSGLEGRDREELRRWYVEHQPDGRPDRLYQGWWEARAARQRFWRSLPTTMIMEERSDRGTTHLRIRGVYDQLGEVVEPGVPPMLIAPGSDPSIASRLEFARWLLSPDHPLTARVTVNRYWQRYFGIGLVATPEDFGVQGERPSHPQLLDWLAAEFVSSGWDVKYLQRLMVTSATYRQSSAVSPAQWQEDPDNRWLARGPRKRLTAHQLRDQALLVSGLLVRRVGGPSVSPYQPENLWAEMSNMQYRQSTGADLYRRSLYTIWKRTVAPPSMMVLDAADRESCIVRPKETNTPLQALTLLNETLFVEAARGFAERILEQPESERLRYAFQAVTSRAPREAEERLLRDAWEAYEQCFAEDPESAGQLLALGADVPPRRWDPVEWAAAMTLANLLLNLDEAVSKP